MDYIYHRFYVSKICAGFSEAHLFHALLYNRINWWKKTLIQPPITRCFGTYQAMIWSTRNEACMIFSCLFYCPIWGILSMLFFSRRICCSPESARSVLQLINNVISHSPIFLIWSVPQPLGLGDAIKHYLATACYDWPYSPLHYLLLWLFLPACSLPLLPVTPPLIMSLTTALSWKNILWGQRYVKPVQLLCDTEESERLT